MKKRKKEKKIIRSTNKKSFDQTFASEASKSLDYICASSKTC